MAGKKKQNVPSSAQTHKEYEKGFSPALKAKIAESEAKHNSLPTGQKNRGSAMKAWEKGEAHTPGQNE